MNTMNMPGFTAEASLYKRSGRYQSVATQSFSSGEQRVISQMRAGGGLGGFWCEAWCDAKFAACCLLCPETGPAAGACAALCYTEVLEPCLQRCDGFGVGFDGFFAA